MGESKRKAEQSKRRGRGLVISPHINVEGRSTTIVSNQFDPTRLRFWTLFFDTLAWPENSFFNLSMEGYPEAQFLVENSILIRPFVRMISPVDDSLIFSMAHVAAFETLESMEPNVWALDQGEHSIQLGSQWDHERSHITLELLNAIPIPDKDVPLQDILEFKEKRKTELDNFRKQIDGIYLSIKSSRDSKYALQVAREELDNSCAELLNFSKASKLRFLVGSLKPTFNIAIGTAAGEHLGKLAGDYLGPIFEGLTLDMPATSNLIGAAIGLGSGLTISLQAGGVNMKPRNSPYAYVTSYHKEVFIV